jgi:hypothetical protein
MGLVRCFAAVLADVVDASAAVPSLCASRFVPQQTAVFEVQTLEETQIPFHVRRLFNQSCMQRQVRTQGTRFLPNADAPRPVL